MTKRRTIAAVATSAVAGFFVWKFPTAMAHLAVCILAAAVLVALLALFARETAAPKGGPR